jgi:phage terminase large subunit-like protein
MLKAILHGKAGRVSDGTNHSVSWSRLFNTREDLLTSTFFERFAYLSASVQTTLIQHWFQTVRSATNTSCLLSNLGDFEGIDYWPQYPLVNDASRSFVEPDLLLRFSQVNILIEVKPPAGGDQYEQQWRNEIIGFTESSEEPDKAFYFLAIGRNHKIDFEACSARFLTLFQPWLHGMAAVEWQFVADKLVHLRQHDVELYNQQDLRILDDMIQALKLYGLITSEFTWATLLSYNLPKLTLNQPRLSQHSLPSQKLRPFSQLHAWQKKPPLQNLQNSPLIYWQRAFK